MPSSGGEATRLTTTENFLNAPKNAAWSPDSSEIAYTAFVSMIIKDLRGNVKDNINLQGLNNFMDIHWDPEESDMIYFKARPAQDASFAMYIYGLSRKSGEVGEIRKIGFFDMDLDVSPAGDKLVYTKPNKK